MKQTAVIAIVLVLLLLFVACGEGENRSNPVSYTYNPSAATQQQSTEAQTDTTSVTAAADEVISVDTSWQDNYRLTFDYFVEGVTDSTVSVSEKKTATMYVTTDASDGLTLYYLQNGVNVDYYRIYDDNSTQQHMLYKDHSISAIKSRFMSMSETETDFSAKPNSAYAGESAVAGRDAKLYIQRGYKDGVLTATAYYYIDLQYGFCSKAQVYDENEELTMSWELTSFSAGTVTNDDISIDLSEYVFEEVSE